MKILLDTQIAVWAWIDPDRIPGTVRLALEDPSNRVYCSQVSSMEIQIKFGLGKLTLPDHPRCFVPEAVRASGFNYVPLSDHSIFFHVMNGTSQY